MQYNTPQDRMSPDPDPNAAVCADDLLDCIWRLDTQLRIIDASPATQTMLGIPAAALPGSPLADHTTAAAFADLREVLAGLLAGPDRTAGILHTIELRHADGHLVPCELHGRFRLDRNGEPVDLVCILRNITRRILCEQATRKADHQRFEQQKMAAIAQLAGGVVDDLESLLKALDACPETEDHPELAPLRQQAAERIGQLRTLAGRQDLEYRDVEIDAVVVDLIAELRRDLPANVTLAYQNRAGNSTIWADHDQILTVLRSLCLNARDAMPQGGAITVATGLREAEPAVSGPPTAAPRPWVTVEVRDTGQGMDTATRERILDPFFTTRSGRSGLSLPLAHGVIAQHGGRMQVESEPGSGSVFRVLLQARRVGEVAAAVGREATTRATILLVDDDPEILRYCSEVLRSRNFEVVVCADGVEALAYIAGDDPVDMVVLDWALPGLDGRRVREQMARRHPLLPLMIISGRPREDYESLGGIDRETPWLVKPFTPAALLAAVRASLSAKEPGT